MTDPILDVNRRRILKCATGATLVVVAGATQGCARGPFSSYQSDALELWRGWQQPHQSAAYTIVAAAVLAASPHNTQPWRFIVFQDRIDLYADTTRNLGSFDPYLREMYIGLGCAIENAAVAARGLGYETEIDLMPETPNQTHVATIRLNVAAPEKGAHFHAIAKRHTHRGAYLKGRPIPARAVESLKAQHCDIEIQLSLFSADGQRGRLFTKASVDATKTIIADEQMALDSYAWYRHSKTEMEAHRDGASLMNAGLSPVMYRIALLLPKPDARTADAYWLKATRNTQCATASMYGVVAVRDLYDKQQALKAGRLWQRLHLQATALGIAMQPINQIMERADRERSTRKTNSQQISLKTLTGDAEWLPTFGFRFGYAANTAPPSPRRRLIEVLRT